MIFGARRGVLLRWLQRRRLERKVRRQHLLRAAYELLEGASRAGSETALIESSPFQGNRVIGPAAACAACI